MVNETEGMMPKSDVCTVFVPEGYDESFAQLGMDIKNHISHRARAVAKLAEFLSKDHELCSLS